MSSRVNRRTSGGLETSEVDAQLRGIQKQFGRTEQVRNDNGVWLKARRNSDNGLLEIWDGNTWSGPELITDRLDALEAIPTLSGRLTLSADVPTDATGFADVTGLSFAVVAGTTYRFRATIAFAVDDYAFSGSKWSVNGPAASMLAYEARWPSSSTANSVTYSATYDDGSVSAQSANATGNLVRIEGIVTPSASGTLAMRFAAEASGGARTVTALAGSTLEYW